MTPAQLSTLKATVLADPTLATMSSGPGTDYAAIAAALNSASSPAFKVWRTSVPVAEYRVAITWTEVDALSAGKARIWEWLTGSMTLPVVASDANVRQGIADAFAANSATRAALLVAAKRTASRAEAALATGTGSDAVPGTLTFEGNVSIEDVNQMFRA